MFITKRYYKTKTTFINILFIETHSIFDQLININFSNFIFILLIDRDIHLLCYLYTLIKKTN